MKKKITRLMLMLFFLTTFSAALYAEVFQSEVRSVNGHEITVVKKDPADGTAGTEEVHVMTSQKTEFENLVSLEELRPGDEVKVSAEWRAEKNYWLAKSLSVEKVKIRQ